MPPKSTVDIVFEYTPKQGELWFSKAPKRLSVGGVRSGKTLGALMYGIANYVFPYRRCDILVLRRTFRELEAGAITDLKTFVSHKGKPLFDWHDSKHVATFENGSRVFFGSCTHNKERDIEQYLGQGYPFILLDECAQFSSDAWELLIARNTVNPSCEPGPNGEMPTPIIWGCTNPIGPFWLYYKTLFVDKKPVGVEGAVREPDGRWWVNEYGERRCVYEPSEYACTHSTVLDNPHILKRDPKIFERLNALPPAKREKLLFGLLDRIEGQYYDCFSQEHHVVNLREDPEAIIWQPYQAVWAGWDWGMAHSNAIYFFTRALVRKSAGSDYKLKTVCFDEIVTTGKGQQEMVSLFAAKAKLPGSKMPVKLSAIYFSHEKFARSMEAHSPADVITRLLREAGQCPVSPATRDRIGRASFLYNLLYTGELVFLDNCQEIIQALPTLQRDPDHLDDVLKVDNKADDCYDACAYGLFGQLAARKKPSEQVAREKIAAISDPFIRRMTQFKLTMDAEKKRTPVPFAWQRHLREPDGARFH